MKVLGLFILLTTIGLGPVRGQTPAPAGATFDTSVAPGANYDKAEFRLWVPEGAGAIRAVVSLMPGSNGDARSQVTDPVWQAFATKHHLALVGSRLTDKPHEQSFIEHYIDVSNGSGQAFLDALGTLASQSKHAEIATAPLLLWGMSAGGEFNYEFTAWKPERVAAFVVNKGGIYYSALTSKAAREVPGILFVGGKDLETRTNTIAGLFAVNRRAGALWAFADEPSAAHIVGKSRDVSLIFFEDVLSLRLGDETNGATLKSLTEKMGFVGDGKSKAFQAAAENAPGNTLTSWLPTERVAKAWQGMVGGQ